MKKIITWIRSVEQIAGEVYQLAASVYSKDEILSKFFSVLAEEEAWHYSLMDNAEAYLEREPDFLSAISVDQATGDRIFNYFVALRNGINTGSISREELFERVVEAEFSEWNDIFVYVVNTLKEKTDEFRYAATRIQAHVRAIEEHVREVEKRPDILGKIVGLPPVWIEKILIVEDDPLIAKLISSLLHREGEIDVVENGKDALELMRDKYYKLIISDIDMPVMDGLSMYKQSITLYPKINSRFLFITGNLSQERIAFFMDNDIRYLSKPMEIKQFKDETYRIIMSG